MSNVPPVVPPAPLQPLVGRKRLRVIQDALVSKVSDGLEDLDWFKPHSHRRPVEVVAEPIDNGTEILPNKISVVLEDSFSQELELGSHLSSDTWECYIDIYAQDNLVGQGLAADIAAILSGKMPSIGHGATRLTVIDYRDSQIAFYCDIENVLIERQRDSDRKYLRYWWMIAFDLIDSYYDDIISG